MPVNFTERVVARLSPPNEEAKASCCEYRDSQAIGLTVSVTKRGAKSYSFRGTFRQQKIFLPIGDVGVISLEEARNKARQFRADIQRGLDPRIARRKVDLVPFFADFAEDYLAWAQTYKRSHDDDRSKLTNHLLPEFGPRVLTDISTEMIQRYLAKKALTHSNATLNRHLSLLSGIFKLAIDRSFVSANPCKSIKKFKEVACKTEFLSIDEVHRLLQAADHNPCRTSVLAIKALLFTGLRLEEVLQSKLENLDLDNALLHIPLTKSGKSRYVHLNDRALEVFKEAIVRSGNSPWIFAGRDPSQPIRNIRKTFRTILSDAGLRMIRIHDLRHTHASLLVQQGVPLAHVQQLLHHASPSTTLRYAHLCDQTLRQATQAFANNLFK